MRMDSILTNEKQLGQFPCHRLKHVGKPTNLLSDSIQRIDPCEIAFAFEQGVGGRRPSSLPN
ncbi:hypothetical protein ACFLUG_03100 [Chloroflexota bacterium]